MTKELHILEYIGDKAVDLTYLNWVLSKFPLHRRHPQDIKYAYNKFAKDKGLPTLTTKEMRTIL